MFYGKIVNDVCQIWHDDQQLVLEDSLKLRNHSPTGFSWGYAGSGPSQSSLAILLELVGEEDATRLYQSFKRDFVAKWSIDKEWTMDDNVIREWATRMKVVL